ncbi:MAG: HEAT repeat domain-containing protein, partial [Myxococcota bacterium]
TMEPFFSRLGFSNFPWSRRHLQGPSARQMIAHLAERHGFRKERGGWWGQVDGLFVTLAQTESSIKITFAFPKDQPADFAFVLDSKRPLPTWTYSPLDLVITGDARFDAEAHVTGSAVAALGRLDLGTRERLREWPGLTLRERRLSVSVSEQRLADQFSGTLHALRHVAAHLCVPTKSIRGRLEARLEQGREPPTHLQAVLQALACRGWLDDSLRRSLMAHPCCELRIDACTLAPLPDTEASNILWSMTEDRRVRAAWRAEALHRWMARAASIEVRRAGLKKLANSAFAEVVAASCFWWRQQPDARERLATWLRHPAPEVRAAAMVAIGGLLTVLQPHEEILIIRALHSRSEDIVVQAALQALSVGGTRSLRAVRDFLETRRSSPEIRRSAKATLKALQLRKHLLPGRLAIIDDPKRGNLSLPGGLRILPSVRGTAAKQ